MTATAPLPAVRSGHAPANYQPTDKHGALLVAAEAVRIAREFGLAEPSGIGVGPTGVIEAAMPMADLLGWQKILDRPQVDKVAAKAGGLLVHGYFERRPWLLRSTDGGAW